MKNSKNIWIKATVVATLLAARAAFAQQGEISITNTIYEPGLTKPIPIALTGFSGELADVIRFDLYVQGFKFVGPDEAQFILSGSNNGNVQGRLVDRFNKDSLLARSYTGTSVRRQAHAFTDDVVEAILRRPGIAQTRIACKVDLGRNSEIYVADFDGHNPVAATKDNTLSVAPAWVPGKLALYYTSYKMDNPDILYHDLHTGQRRTVARYSGSNLSPAPSPDGSKVAMVLSFSGAVDLYVADADGSNLKRLTRSKASESAPCWSPDGKWICFATQFGARRALAKVSASGGEVHRLPTSGVSNPTEPDWSPDGKWIAFTAQMGDFELCVVPAEGGTATVLVSGEDPSWSPNSRTLAFTRRVGGRRTLSLLDVPTKQHKDVPRISGSNNSQPSWAR